MPLPPLFPELADICTEDGPGPRANPVGCDDACGRCGVLRGNRRRAALDFSDFDNPRVLCEICQVNDSNVHYESLRPAGGALANEKTYLYMLVSEHDPRFYYVGVTCLLETRLREHNWAHLTEFERQMTLVTRDSHDGTFWPRDKYTRFPDYGSDNPRPTRSTAMHGPYRLIFTEEFNDRHSAMQRERFYHTLTEGDPRAGGSSLAESLIRAELRLWHPDLWGKLRVAAGNGEMVALHQQLRFVG